MNRFFGFADRVLAMKRANSELERVDAGKGDTLLQEPDDQPRYRLRRSDKIIANRAHARYRQSVLWPFVFFVIRGRSACAFTFSRSAPRRKFVYHEGLA